MKPRFRRLSKMGIRRKKCDAYGCTAKGYSHWSVCADNVDDKPQYRILCKGCDIKMNEMAMEFVFGKLPQTQWKVQAYRMKVINEA